MRKWKYVLAICLMALDLFSFAELGKEMSASGSSLVLKLLHLTGHKVYYGWAMIGLAVLFIAGLVLIAHWVFHDVKRWVLQEVGESE